MDLSGEFLPGVDLVDVCLWAFTIFFFGLIFYLRREDRREGYPLEVDTTGKPESGGVFWFPPKKTFRLPHGRGEINAAHGAPDTRDLALKRTAPWPGAPNEPTGDPMRDAVGPASYAMRADVPDLTDDGRNRIVPYRLGDGYEVAEGDPDPRGMTVYGVDGKAAGEVVDLWVDRAEAIIRYLEVKVDVEGASKTVLLPIPFCKIKGGRRSRVDVEAVLAAHFANVPPTKSPDSVTRLEEDMISGYFGGGKLYATPSRVEPVL
ncbi:MAG: photosynthetic reaction center subunit H [Pseudomonadota bacterium]